MDISNVIDFLKNSPIRTRYIRNVLETSEIPSLRYLLDRFYTDLNLPPMTAFGLMCLPDKRNLTQEGARNGLLDMCRKSQDREAVEFYFSHGPMKPEGRSFFEALRALRREKCPTLGLKRFLKSRGNDVYGEFSYEKMKKYENRGHRRFFYPDIHFFNTVLAFYGLLPANVGIRACLISYEYYKKSCERERIFMSESFRFSGDDT